MSKSSTPKEPPRIELVKALLEVCNKKIGLFRTAPRPEYIANLSQRLAEDRYTPEMVDFILEQAARLYDQYPSLAQVIQMAIDFRVREKFSHVPMLNEPATKRSRKTPWPMMLELYMENLSNNSGNDLLKRLIGLSEEDIHELRSFYEARDFSNPRARVIISQRWGESKESEDAWVRIDDLSEAGSP